VLVLFLLVDLVVFHYLHLVDSWVLKPHRKIYAHRIMAAGLLCNAAQTIIDFRTFLAFYHLLSLKDLK
jgi:hypothetical protein